MHYQYRRKSSLFLIHVKKKLLQKYIRLLCFREVETSRTLTSIHGLVVEYNVAIVVTRVRFPVDAIFFLQYQSKYNSIFRNLLIRAHTIIVSQKKIFVLLKNASTGNRTRVTTMATLYSTTKP